ncbi:PQQ-dependent sugar dehydrogenase [Stutzerimonas tarimensis]|uniref:PQQ-dependent sugar dehydrogenase n=1 Tax=Stutzerimonas tarimensis TaxID=1507735 RepID=A0ABV7T7S8_9GAMM
MLRPSLIAALCATLAVPGLQAAERFDTEKGTLTVREITAALENPWSLAFLPGGDQMLVTERPGRLRVLSLDGTLSEPLAGTPEVHAQRQGGLLDVQLSPDFEQDRMVYLTYAEAGENGNSGTAAGRGRLSDDLSRLENFEVIFRQQPKLSDGLHYGSRLAFDEGYLFIALGDNNQRATAQELDKHQGSIIRIRPDGSVPDDNPFVGRDDALAEIWSYGHRNQQGAAINPWTGALWVHDHGPRGGDEINLPEMGKNYGWPLATHGINYSGQPIPEAKGQTVDGAEPPHHVWMQSPAVSGMAFYDAERFEGWQRNLFVGALADRSLIRLELDGDAIIHEERLLKPLGKRVRDVRLGPDGFLYVVTDDASGQVLQLGLEQQ